MVGPWWKSSAMGIDITEFRKTQAALKEANEQLEQSVQERTAALFESEQKYRSLSSDLEVRVQAHTAELERKNRELQDFAFIASHDLNEPLRKIQTFIVTLPVDGNNAQPQ
ncbi:MAG: hypothetical protein C4576_33900 [Desulfobacteraceae bacterium]|nr:MAG: hypothetical protein C4576_33900 [Desulfobacteraceae bacterium]